MEEAQDTKTSNYTYTKRQTHKETDAYKTEPTA